VSNYTKSTNFATKDALTSGNPLKIVKGTEIDTEFNNIQTAIATKADSASPTFTGTVVITTATIATANISAGTITGITDLAIADGGTGASTAANARTNLGLVIGTNVQAWDTDLDTWATKTAPSGTVVGTTDTQTLTNKTLTSPTIGGTPVMGASVISSASAQVSSSGTSIDFTSIPSWVKRVTVMLSGVSTSGTANLRLQIGAGSVQTTGYISTFGTINGSTPGSGSDTSGFAMGGAGSAATTTSGAVILTTLGADAWVVSGTFKNGTSSVSYVGGDVTLSGALDRVRITTANGTDTFDAGSINILYE